MDRPSAASRAARQRAGAQHSAGRQGRGDPPPAGDGGGDRRRSAAACAGGADPRCLESHHHAERDPARHASQISRRWSRPSREGLDPYAEGGATLMAKLFLRTFGCQMNEYDSEKIADVLREAEGFEPAARPEDADLIVFNTCSVREKAQEKLFADLGRVKHLKRAKPGLMIAVGGCVASQEGPAVVERAPYVDVVFGPQTLHRLPQLLERRRSTGRPQVDISFPEIEKFDHLPPARVEGAAAFVSIMEGCSKYCSFCVVPYTRGEEVSRPFDDVIAEIAHLAAQGVKEVTLLGQNVNAYRGAMNPGGEVADLATLLEYLDEVP